jgi:hypothetical protein
MLVFANGAAAKKNGTAASTRNAGCKEQATDDEADGTPPARCHSEQIDDAQSGAAS